MVPHEPNLWKTRRVAEALGLSVSTVKRLVDSGAIRAARTVGKHRLVAPAEALRFARERNLPLADPGAGAGATAAAPPPSEPEPITEATVEALVAALRFGRLAEVGRLVRAAYGDGPRAAELADRLVRPAMAAIGHGWSTGALDVFQEHRATRALEGELLALNARLQATAVAATPNAAAAAARPLAIGAAPEDDPYTLAGLLCELGLREQGWDVMNLGANLPLASLARAVEAHRPRLVWLSAGYLEDTDRFLADYARFHRTAARLGTALFLGGQALGPSVRDRLDAAGFGERVAHLVEFARLLHAGPAAPAADRDDRDDDPEAPAGPRPSAP